jgi:hypothetical protein
MCRTCIQQMHKVTQGLLCQGMPQTGKSRPSRSSTLSSPCGSRHILFLRGREDGRRSRREVTGGCCTCPGQQHRIPQRVALPGHAPHGKVAPLTQQHTQLALRHDGSVRSYATGAKERQHNRHVIQADVKQPGQPHGRLTCRDMQHQAHLTLNRSGRLTPPAAPCGPSGSAASSACSSESTCSSSSGRGRRNQISTHNTTDATTVAVG